MKKRWIINFVEHSPICGLKGSVVGIYDSREAAYATVKSCIEIWRNIHQDEGVEVDFDKMAAWFDYDPNDGCRWFITQIEIP